MSKKSQKVAGRPRKNTKAPVPWDTIDKFLVHGEKIQEGKSTRTHFPSYREIGERFGVSHSSVARYSQRHNCLQRRQQTAKEVLRISDKKLAQFRADELLGTNATAGATWTFATAVNPNGRLPLGASLGGGDTFLITFPSQLGQTYRVERTDSLAPPDWQAITNNLPGTGEALAVPDTGVSTQTQRFYRALILPP